MNIRTATLQDIDQIAAVEKECFPAAEAATKEEFEQRLSHYGDHFWLMFEDDKLIAFVDGMVTDQEDLTDEMYENASLHHPNGDYQLIFSVCILPDYHHKGYARKMVKEYVSLKENEVNGFVLTCKDHLIPFYESCGFHFKGVSKSVHGNAKWNDMVRINERER